MVATGQQLQQINTTNNHTSPEQPIEQQQQKRKKDQTPYDLGNIDIQ